GGGGGGARRGGVAREPERADAAWRECGAGRLFRMRPSKPIEVDASGGRGPCGERGGCRGRAPEGPRRAARLAARARFLALALLLPLAVPSAGHAQELLARADSLMNAGRVFAAESIFYYMVRRDP